MAARKIQSRGDTVATVDAARQTQAERRETAERAILEAAKKIVADRGLDDLTLNEAGEAAGYSRALPGHYFGAKAALVAALADHIMAGYDERIRSTVANTGGLQQLCDLLAFCCDDAVTDPVSVRAFQSIIAAGLTRTELRPLVDRMTRQSVEDIAGLIRNGRENGEIRSDVRARVEASLILASLRGVLFQWLVIPDHVSLSRMRDSLVTNVRNSLTA